MAPMRIVARVTWVAPHPREDPKVAGMRLRIGLVNGESSCMGMKVLKPHAQAGPVVEEEAAGEVVGFV